MTLKVILQKKKSVLISKLQLKSSQNAQFSQNKIGSYQCTQAVCSTFAEIHSTLTPRCIDALFRVRIPFQSLVQRAIQIPVRNPDSSSQSRFQSAIQIPVRQSRVQSMFTQVTERPWEIDTRDLPIFILRHQKRLVFVLHLALFRLVGLSKRKITEPSLTAFTGFPFAFVFRCTFSECVNCHGKSNHSREKQFAHGKSNSLTAKANHSRQEHIHSRQKQINSE